MNDSGTVTVEMDSQLKLKEVEKINTLKHVVMDSLNKDQKKLETPVKVILSPKQFTNPIQKSTTPKHEKELPTTSSYEVMLFIEL